MIHSSRHTREPSRSSSSATPALMLQGTSSDAGKTLLTAALCRIFTQDGLRVAPFKSQNMALNSCVTQDGLEMGRAQALQAAACRLPPDVRMNPILLKPTSDMGSQVILLGKSQGVMRVREYWSFKPQAFAAACAAYDSLSAEADVMILEGAGSPAEINLRQHDIVNMTMARYANARVLLAGDIDRGGVFASLVGTLALLQDWERDLIGGLIINKFRGDASLLPPALDFVREKTTKPVLGVVPWIEGLNLPDEDSVSFKAGQAVAGHAANSSTAEDAPALDIVLIDLPRISNFTDMDALTAEPDVRLRTVLRPENLGQPDLIILPGSKNTVSDLAHLRASGLAHALLDLLRAESASMLIGICGGLQMLGTWIHDPHGLEQGGSAPGLGLLPLTSVLEPDKLLRRTRARSKPEGLEVEGYEIHHGRTHQDEGSTCAQWIVDAEGAPLGWQRQDGRVRGAYVHGLFDNDNFRRHLLDGLRQRKGLAPLGRTTPYSLESALDRLADVTRKALDMGAVRALLRI